MHYQIGDTFRMQIGRGMYTMVITEVMSGPEQKYKLDYSSQHDNDMVPAVLTICTAEELASLEQVN